MTRTYALTQSFLQQAVKGRTAPAGRGKTDVATGRGGRRSLQRALGNGTMTRSMGRDPGSGQMETAPIPASPALEAGMRALQGGGRPLAGTERAYFEPRFGADLGDVRLHTGEGAERAAGEIRARAFTLGQDIYFGTGAYGPATAKGRYVLAHELAHVVQRQEAKGGEETVFRMSWQPETLISEDIKPFAGRPDLVGDDYSTSQDVVIWVPDDGQTYWCHGYTFGGKDAPGGPYSTYGREVQEKILSMDGWRPNPSCQAAGDDILVFYNDKYQISHSGIIREVVLKLESERFCTDSILRLVIDNLLTLKNGSRGPRTNEAVRKIQQALLDLGFDLPEYGADGLFGNETESAVRRYQTARGITIDGKVGPQTLGTLDREPAFVKSGLVDEEQSMLESKWGWSSHNTSSWRINSLYGNYRCYSHSPARTPAGARADHELP